MGEGTIANRDGLTRRRLLGGAAAVAAGTAGGCVGPLQGLLGGENPDRVSLKIKTLPADEDAIATRIARQLTTRLNSAGIQSEIVLLPPGQLRREVLLDHEFDIYVGTMPVPHDPDFLRSLTHSRFSEAQGWQNPFGFADLQLNELLDAQRDQSGSERTETVGEIQEILAREQPFTPLVAAEAISAVGTDRFTGWSDFPSRDPLWFVGLRQADGTPVNPQPDRSLTMAVTDAGSTESFNPLPGGFTGGDIATELLYDPIARFYDGALRPWLAESWAWDEENPEQLMVRLRNDLTWHDGTPLTATDLQFTFSFLSDTTLNEGDPYAPAPRYRGRADLVESTRVVNERTLQVRLDAAAPAALTALTVPPLPKHIWTQRSAVVDASRGLTEALTWENPQPVGSGPMAFDRRSRGESLRLKRFENHPLNREADSQLTRRFNDLAMTELRLLVAPSDVTAINHVEVGEADVTAPTIGSDSVARIARNDDLTLVVSSARDIYHLGFNVRRNPLRNPNFRRTIAALLDKQQIADSVFDGFARPLATPLVDEAWIPDALQWNGVDPEVPFLGSDGELDIEAVQSQFRDAGYRYTDDGRLVYR